MTDNSPIREFRGEWSCFSNFTPSLIHYEGDAYATVEAAFQAAKTLDFSERHAIQACVSSPAAKKMGRKVTLRPGWDRMKVDVMELLVTQKFMTYYDLRKVLIASAPRELQEGNRWNDRFWGVDLDTGEGENHLGQILMRLRNHLVITKNLLREL
jgi:ribA/ribD-fused uncharacterized protein